MPATFGVQNTFGLSPASGHAHESSDDASIEVATLRDENGVTVVAKPKKMMTRNISLSGKGLPNFADVAAGAITAGTAFVTSVKQSESNDDFPGFEIQAVAYQDN